METRDCNHAREKLHKVIKREYGSKYLDEILSLLQVGYEGYNDKVMEAYMACTNYLFLNTWKDYPNMKLNRARGKN